MHISIFHVATGGLFDWMTYIDKTAGKEERSTETTKSSQSPHSHHGLIMDSDESDHRFVKISSIIYFSE